MVKKTGFIASYIKEIKKEYNKQLELTKKRNQQSVQSNQNEIKLTINVGEPKESNERYRKCFLDELLKLESYINEKAKTQHVPNLDAFDQKEVITFLYPDLDGRYCPNCGYNFGKPLVRGKVCPECGEKLVVRSGILLDERCLKNVEDKQNLWRPIRLFRESERERIQTNIKYGLLISAATDIAKTYEDLGDYSKAWDVMSGKTCPICEVQVIEYINCMDWDPSQKGRLLEVAEWRANFLERCLKQHVWKVDAKWTAMTYVELLCEAINYKVSLDCSEVVNAIYKIKHLAMEYNDNLPSLEEIVWASTHKSHPEYSAKILKLLS